MSELLIRVCGIPAIAEVHHYTPGDPGRTWGPPERCHPPEPEDVEFTLRDRRGYRAAWLEAKAEREGEDLTELVLDAIHRQREAA